MNQPPLGVCFDIFLFFCWFHICRVASYSIIIIVFCSISFFSGYVCVCVCSLVFGGLIVLSVCLSLLYSESCIDFLMGSVGVAYIGEHDQTSGCEC